MRGGISRALSRWAVRSGRLFAIAEDYLPYIGSSVIGADGGGWGEGRGPSDPLDCSFGIAGEEGLNAPAR